MDHATLIELGITEMTGVNQVLDAHVSYTRKLHACKCIVASSSFVRWHISVNIVRQIPSDVFNLTSNNHLSREQKMIGGTDYPSIYFHFYYTVVYTLFLTLTRAFTNGLQ